MNDAPEFGIPLQPGTQGDGQTPVYKSAFSIRKPYDEPQAIPLAVQPESAFPPPVTLKLRIADEGKVVPPPPRSAPSQPTAPRPAMRFSYDYAEPQEKPRTPPPSWEKAAAEPKARPGFPLCKKCGNIFRENLMFHVDEGELCPHCYNPYLHKVRSKRFFARLPGAFLYPLKGNNSVMLVVGSLFFGVLSFFAKLSTLGVGAIGLVGGGYLTEYFMSIIIRSAEGHDDLPDWPDFGVGTICSASARYLVAWLFPLLPAAIFYFLFVRTGFGGFFEELALMLAAPTLQGFLFLILFFVGMFLIPASTASAAMTNSFVGTLVQISPHNTIPLILRALPEYCLACGLLITTTTFNMFLRVAFIQYGGGIVGGLVSIPFILYFAIVEMRLLGMFWGLSDRRLQNKILWADHEAGRLLPSRKVQVAPGVVTE
jgi:hypothetical protein